MKGIIIPIKNVKIRFRIRGQIFDTASIPGGNTTPFEIPITKETQQAFGHPELLGNREILGNSYENVQLIYKGNPLLSGYILFLNAQGSYRVTFNFGVAGIKPFGSKRLRSFELGGIRTLDYPPGFPNLYSHAGLVANNPDNYDYLFPCFRNASLYQDVQFYSASREEGSEYFNLYRGGQYIESDSPGSAFPYFYYRNTFIPFAKLNYVLKQIFAEAGIQFQSTWLDEEEIKSLLIYNTVVEGSAFGIWNPPISAIRDWPTTFDLRKHVPDITVSELLNALRNQFNLFFNWNFFDNSCTLDAFRDIHRQMDAWDVTDSIIGKILIEPANEAIKNLQYQSESGDDQFIDESLLRLINDPAGQSVDLRTGLIAMETNLDDASAQTRSWFIPTTDQPGNAENYPPGVGISAPFGLRLLFYRGMQPDSVADDYPLATPGDRKYGDVEIGGTNYTLYPDGAKGLYNVWWKDYDNFKKNARKASCSVAIELDDILRLDLRKKVRIKDSLFYINEVQFDLGNSISPAEFELFRL